jgi:hypothetical protein
LTNSLGDKKSWRTTVIVLVSISTILFIIQRTSMQFLDPVFEVCIFYIPTTLSIIIYYWLNKKTETSQTSAHINNK